MTRPRDKAQKTQSKATQLPIAIIRRNRRKLLQSGLNRSELTMLEEIALLMRDGRFRLMRGAYLAQCLGISRQWANALLRRLSDLQLIVRFKTGYIRLCTERLNKISETACKKIRRKQSNWLKSLYKSRCGNNHIPKKDISLNKEEKGVSIPSRQEALEALKRCYVPPHLRKSL